MIIVVYFPSEVVFEMFAAVGKNAIVGVTILQAFFEAYDHIYIKSFAIRVFALFAFRRLIF